MKLLSTLSIHSFINEYQLKNETGQPIDFRDHFFLFDIYKDFSSKLCIMKAAQVGATTMEALKALWAVKNKKMDAVYILPTDTDVNSMVNSKVNRIIVQNPILLDWVKDKDSVEQKQVGNNYIHYRGSWTQKQAIMVTSDWNIYDEVDSCFEPDTEILTKKGWIKIQNIRLSDKICALNQDDHRIVWQYPTKKQELNYNDKLYRFTANSINIAVTKNHRMWARTASHSGFQGRKNPYTLHKSSELIGKKFVMSSKGIWKHCDKDDGFTFIPSWQTKKNGENVYFSAKKVDKLAFYEFLGWYLTEGNVCKRRNKHNKQRASGDIIIMQKAEKERNLIVDCVKRLGYTPKINKNKCGISQIIIRDRQLALFLQSLGYSNEKYLPDRYLYARKKYLEAFLTASILGDGDDRNVISTISSKLADCYQIVALQLGKTASIYNSKRYNNEQKIYRVGINSIPYRRFNGFRYSNTTGTVKEENYKGMVYCVSVPNGVVLVRGKDKKIPLWCGNCKQDIIEQYSTRLQHSKLKWEHFFSHPSSVGTGIERYWQKSDQKHWFIKCSCGEEQFMEWPKSFNLDKEIYVCKYCGKELTNEERRVGRWVAKYKDREFSGYWIPLFIAPWVSAKEIIKYYKDKSEEYFYNKVLGLPYVGGGNKLTKAHLMQNLTGERIIIPDDNERVIIGVDTGTNIHYVVGCQEGLFHYDSSKNYDEIEELLKRFKRSIAIIDQGGDLIGSRALREKYPGRVFLCLFGVDRKTKELVRWGKNDEDGAVTADRNRSIQMVVDEFTDGRIALQGTENDWYDYWLEWNNLTRIKEIDEKTGSVKRKIWVKNGKSDLTFATVYWRIGMSRFGSLENKVISIKKAEIPEAPVVYPGDKIDARFAIKSYKKVKKYDWRKIQ